MAKTTEKTVKSKGKGKGKGKASNGTLPEGKPQSKKSRDAEGASGPTLRIPLAMIHVDYEFNARKKPDTGEYDGVTGIAASMLEMGQQQPVTVRRLTVEEMKTYKTAATHFLVSGFTRYDAAVSLQWEEIKATVEDMDMETARIINIAENTARNNLSPYDAAVGLFDLLTNQGISVRKLADKIGKNHSYVSELTNIVKVGNPLILREWRNGHEKATLANLKDVCWDSKRRDSHAKQWQAWQVLTHRTPDAVGEEDGEGGEGEKETKPNTDRKRPTVKTILKALEAVKRSDASKEYLNGVKAALRFAGVLDDNIPHVWNQKVRDALDAEAAEAKAEAKRQAKLNKKL